MEELRAARNELLRELERLITTIQREASELTTVVAKGPSAAFNEGKHETLFEQKKECLDEADRQLAVMAAACVDTVPLSTVHRHLHDGYLRRQQHLEQLRTNLIDQGIPQGVVGSAEQEARASTARKPVLQSIEQTSEATLHTLNKENSVPFKSNASFSSWKQDSWKLQVSVPARKEPKLSEATLAAMAAAEPGALARTSTPRTLPQDRHQQISSRLSNHRAQLDPNQPTASEEAYHQAPSNISDTTGAFEVSMEQYMSLSSFTRAKVSFEEVTEALCRIQNWAASMANEVWISTAELKSLLQGLPDQELPILLVRLKVIRAEMLKGVRGYHIGRQHS